MTLKCDIAMSLAFLEASGTRELLLLLWDHNAFLAVLLTVSPGRWNNPRFNCQIRKIQYKEPENNGYYNEIKFSSTKEEYPWLSDGQEEELRLTS